MIGALILGLVAGFIGRALVPNDVFSGMRGPASWAVSIVLGLVGAFVGYLVFTRALGIGDDDAFDLGGLLSAIIGVVIVLIIAGFFMRRAGPARG
ncbi:MAG: GlsB/YeaQ/YmgE family stress response membrane protein [Solirubrobacteraceae bacterium]|nr:GlsB/YeaQ/YmgE family stress response membrane protein [Solirubrobacteraceae bacterium]